MALDWNKLRPWNGSDRLAFEELCCQLARHEPAPEGSTFVRRGTPDGGAECLWTLPNGDQWAWQAKYFRAELSTGQWGQVDDSVRTATDRHPRLVRYVVCFAYQFPDGHTDGVSGRDKWNARVTKWVDEAREAGKTIEFDLWGESEIADRLSQEKHRGRKWFWFEQEQLSYQWFEHHLQEQLEDAGARYSPKLNIKLPVASAFGALGLSPQFRDEAAAIYGEARRRYRRFRSFSKRIDLDESIEVLESVAEALWTLCRESFVEGAADEWAMLQGPVPIDGMTGLIGDLAERVHRVEAEIRARREAAEGEEDAGPQSPSDVLRYALGDCVRFWRSLHSLQSFLEEDATRLLNDAAMLLTGDAGMGKTHLLCDVASSGLEDGRPHILLHGKHFVGGDVWQQISRQLGLTCSRVELLGALEAMAEASRCRIVILIDGINESGDLNVWYDRLGSFLVALARCPWIGVALSVRTGYRELVVPDAVLEERLVEVVHYGFRDTEFDAMREYFAHHGIQPTVPLLVPEFSNPLFLKLLCRGLEAQGATQVPTGLRGITAIADLFADSVNANLARRLGFALGRRLVHKLSHALAAEMASARSRYLDYSVAESAARTIAGTSQLAVQLVQGMVAEGLLLTDRWAREEPARETVRFAYERIGDHLLARHLLDEHLDEKCPLESFRPSAPLGELLRDEHACRSNRGLIEAVAVQLPERLRVELPSVVPHVADCQPVVEAFVGSVVWRVADAFGDDAVEYIRRTVARYDSYLFRLLDALVTVGPVPEHVLNADWLHERLAARSMAERDEWWSVFLHRYWGRESGIDRLVWWASSPGDKSALSDRSVELAATTLVWFFSTSNRFLRDRATKALVRLLESRIPICVKLLGKFKAVDAPYVSERLLAVAYGCALRSVDSEAIGLLAGAVYEFAFEDDGLSPHILSRDYARGVLEVALARGVDVGVEPCLFRPPYSSDWPAMTVLSDEKLKQWGRRWDDMPEEEWSRVTLYGSVDGRGLADFSRYVLGDFRRWLDERLGEPAGPSASDRCGSFVESLTPRQRTAWDSWMDALKERAATPPSSLLRHFATLAGEGSASDEADERDAQLDRACADAERSFRSTVRRGTRKHGEFESALAYIRNPSHAGRERFDGALARRWMLSRIIEMGWTVDRFGKFDRSLGWEDHGRSAHKAERIGKKYQWLAFHQLLARLADNFKLLSDPYEETEHPYEGPWNLGYRRDIDPSCLLLGTSRDRMTSAPCWWSPSYDGWHETATANQWLELRDDLPDGAALVQCTRPADSSEWLVLHAHNNWEEPVSPDQDKYDTPRQQVWMWVNSLIVKSSDVPELLAWAADQDGKWAPDAPSHYDVFLGEYPWAPSYKSVLSGLQEWEDAQSIPVPFMRTTEDYVAEGNGFDCSLDDTISLGLPSCFLARELSLEWRGREGQYFLPSGALAAMDPSVMEAGPSAVLFDRALLIDFLRERELSLIWSVLGAKDIVGGSMRTFRGRLNGAGIYELRAEDLQGAMEYRFEKPRET